ncbi:conserved hypothetical protein [Ricinus communis]|uniref:Uncharacterized protein n=1 Tax=Ricinus communis TaxID=3988 RepID=B9T317_RICCO|nr:conserved hypothetical protein [Ricinus communis]
MEAMKLHLTFRLRDATFSRHFNGTSIVYSKGREHKPVLAQAKQIGTFNNITALLAWWRRWCQGCRRITSLNQIIVVYATHRLCLSTTYHCNYQHCQHYLYCNIASAATHFDRMFI